MQLDDELENFEEASNKNVWVEAIADEIRMIEKKKTWNWPIFLQKKM